MKATDLRRLLLAVWVLVGWVTGMAAAAANAAAATVEEARADAAAILIIAAAAAQAPPAPSSGSVEDATAELGGLGGLELWEPSDSEDLEHPHRLLAKYSGGGTSV